MLSRIPPARTDQRAARLEQDLRDALTAGDQFELLYQPLFRLVEAQPRLVGFEARLKWRHPRNGLMSHASFMGVAEKTGLMLPLGDWVLATALRHARALCVANHGVQVQLALHIAAQQLTQPGFATGLAGMLAAEGVAPPSLCLQISEASLADPVATKCLAEIRATGVQVAIDDFAIFYASLAYLRHLPVDVIKLEPHFMDDAAQDPGFVNAVIALAHSAGKRVVFEALQSPSSVWTPALASADMVQAHGFNPPVSADEAAALVAAAPG
jgi:EAL domain-containing protein (putative c-di-GMP-specific phosphodiesterase class I)